MNKLVKLLGVLLVISLLALPLVACATPTLTVSEPMDGVTVTTPSVTVKGTVSDAKATVKVVVYGVSDAGATVKVSDVKPRVGGDGSFSTSVTLTEGENSVKVSATRGGKEATKTLIITYTPPE